MALQYSLSVRNARLDQVETTIGTNAALLIYSGLPPATLEAAPTGTLLVAMSLPADWMSAAAAGVKAKSGTWSGVAVGSGTAGYFRITNGSPTDVGQIQGLIETTGGSPTGDMGLDNTSISISQTVTASTFQITAGNV